MTGGRIGRRPALAAALVGLVVAGAGLVPAIAADHGASSTRAKPAKKTHFVRPRGSAPDTLDRLVVHMTAPAEQNAEEALAASVGGRHGGDVRKGVFRVDVPKGQGGAAADKLRQNGSVKSVEADVRFRSAEVTPANPDPLVPSDEDSVSGAGAAPPPVNERCYSGCALTFDSGATSRIYSQSDFMHIGAA
ncbi:MAG: hypothetical protein LC792_27025, partial [Actinobacteria bacterium]|nr:hypothetical protein [Actinomycetota bacterium]